MSVGAKRHAAAAISSSLRYVGCATVYRVAIAPVFYAEPTGAATKLHLPPRLASWNAAAHPDQVRLTESLQSAAKQLEPSLRAQLAALALRLDIGLPDTVELLTDHDLDNYAYPLAAYLAKMTTAAIASVWCRKRHASESSITVESAAPAISGAPDRRGYRVGIHTTASASSDAYKEQIQAQLVGVAELPEGAVSLQIAFAVGPRRNWMNLWKPTIDALDALLGPARPGTPWNPRDGRIAHLGLHRTIDPALGNQVRIAIVATAQVVRRNHQPRTHPAETEGPLNNGNKN